MGTKNEPGKYDCHDAAMADEPMFTLLARDPDAPMLVRMWASLRAKRVAKGEKKPEDGNKISEALLCAEQMETWRSNNRPKPPPAIPPART